MHWLRTLHAHTHEARDVFRRWHSKHGSRGTCIALCANCGLYAVPVSRSLPPGTANTGAFNSGTANTGAFNGLGNLLPSSGNGNAGVSRSFILSPPVGLCLSVGCFLPLRARLCSAEYAVFYSTDATGSPRSCLFGSPLIATSLGFHRTLIFLCNGD